MMMGNREVTELWKSEGAGISTKRNHGISIFSKKKNQLLWKSLVTRSTRYLFVTAVRHYLDKHEQSISFSSGMIKCRRDDTLKEVIIKLGNRKIQRIYVVDEVGNL
ncbi:hypothetical protein ACET3Z_010457 [Daucus carota]